MLDLLKFFHITGLVYFMCELQVYFIYVCRMVSWLSSQEVDRTKRVQILDEAVCISHSGDTLCKDVNPSILPPAMGKW